jgi:hypothetical protein
MRRIAGIENYRATRHQPMRRKRAAPGRACWLSPAERLGVLGRILSRRDTWLRDRGGDSWLLLYRRARSGRRFGLAHGEILSITAAMICWSVSYGAEVLFLQI